MCYLPNVDLKNILGKIKYRLLRISHTAAHMLQASTKTTAPLARALARALARRNLSAGSAQHTLESFNKSETFFDFSEENYEKVSRILSKYPNNYKQSGIIPMLDLAQRQAGGWLPLAAMDKVAKIVEVSAPPCSTRIRNPCILTFSHFLGPPHACI